MSISLTPQGHMGRARCLAVKQSEWTKCTRGCGFCQVSLKPGAVNFQNCLETRLCHLTGLKSTQSEPFPQDFCLTWRAATEAQAGVGFSHQCSQKEEKDSCVHKHGAWFKVHTRSHLILASAFGIFSLVDISECPCNKGRSFLSCQSFLLYWKWKSERDIQLVDGCVEKAFS